MKKFMMAVLAAAFLCAPAVSFAEDMDMAKIKCKDFLSQKENDIVTIVIWVDGYLSAKSGDTVMGEEWMKKLSMNLAGYCKQNGDKTLMDAINALPSN